MKLNEASIRSNITHDVFSKFSIRVIKLKNQKIYNQVEDTLISINMLCTQNIPHESTHRIPYTMLRLFNIGIQNQSVTVHILWHSLMTSFFFLSFYLSPLGRGGLMTLISHSISPRWRNLLLIHFGTLINKTNKLYYLFSCIQQKARPLSKNFCWISQGSLSAENMISQDDLYLYFFRSYFRQHWIRSKKQVRFISIFSVLFIFFI